MDPLSDPWGWGGHALPSLSSRATVDLGRVGDDLTQGACQARGKPLGGFRAGGWGVGMWDVVGGARDGARGARKKKMIILKN